MPSLLRHLIWFDFRAHRLLLALWAGVLLIQAAVLILGPAVFSHETGGLSWGLSLLIVRCGLMMAVVASAIQSDSVVGTRAFWMTRPIPRLTLLTGKLIPAVAWVVLLPMATAAGTLLALRMSVADALSGAGVIGFEQMVLLALILMAAIVTADLAQLIVAGIAGVTVVALLNSLILPAITSSWPALGLELGGWQPAVYATVVVAGALLASAYQYLTLKAWRSLVMVALTMIVATLLTRIWPVNSRTGDERVVPSSVFSGQDLSLSVTSDRARVTPSEVTGSGTSGSNRKVVFEVVPAGGPPEIAVWPVTARSQVQCPGRPAIEWAGSVSHSASRNVGPLDPEGVPFPSLRRAIGSAELLMPRQGFVYWTQLTTLSDSDYQACLSVTPSLNGEVTLDVYRYRVTASSPLTEGAVMQVRGRALTIVGVSGRDLGLRVHLRETVRVESAPRGSLPSPILSYFVLRNPAKNQALLATRVVMDGYALTLGISSTSVVTTATILDAGLNPDLATRARIDDEWLKGAELLLLEPENLGVVTRPIRVDKMMLPGPER